MSAESAANPAQNLLSQVIPMAGLVAVQPGAVGFPEKPWPGSEGMTTSKASAAVPPWAVGLVRGSMTLSCSRSRASLSMVLAKLAPRAA